jgi:Mn2+/Fe2+ NRAMP family transporter
MMVYMTLGARLGVIGKKSPADLITERVGRPLAALIGIGVFFIAATFQFGNNLGVDSAFKVFEQFEGMKYLVVVFNVVAIVFLFAFKNLYRAVERLMMALVGMMLLSFALNLGFALSYTPEPGDVAELVVAESSEPLLGLPLLGLIGTTFVIPAAFYQAYLVKQKGWGEDELNDGLVDARIGSVLMALITLMIMCTSAAVLRGHELSGVKDVANQLKPLFGSAGQFIFCLGLFSAAFSSFLVNSMIGGFMLSDGLGLGSKPDQLWPRLMTMAVLLTGMGVALYVIQTGIKPIKAIVAAQAITVVASPLMAGALWWLTNREDVMGDKRNGPLTNVLAGVGFILLLAMAAYTAFGKVLPAVQGWFNGA